MILLIYLLIFYSFIFVKCVMNQCMFYEREYELVMQIVFSVFIDAFLAGGKIKTWRTLLCTQFLDTG